MLVKLPEPLKAKTIHLLTALGHICKGDTYLGSIEGRIIVHYIDGTREVFNLRAGIETDEVRRGRDSEKCHLFPWAEPSLSGRLMYYTDKGEVIESTWNIYHSYFDLSKNNVPIEYIEVVDPDPDSVAFTVYAITIEVINK